jgi:hypothetical protein
MDFRSALRMAVREDLYEPDSTLTGRVRVRVRVRIGV